jgi:CheY-like chemotaxis protein
VARILVIDDDAAVRDMLEEMLRGVGHDVTKAPDGAAGLEMHRESPADLVIADIFMPGKEGIATIRELRAENPDLAILAISGGGRFGSRDLSETIDYLHVARRVGASGVLEKPIEWEELAETVAGLLGASPARRVPPATT